MPEAAVTVKAVPIAYEELPGPQGIPVLGNATQVRPEAFHQQLEAWAREYGGKFRFRITNRHMLAITDPEAISSVLRWRPQQFVKTPRLVQVAKDMGFHGVFSANGDDWKRQRQLVMPGLDPAHLHAYLPSLITVTDRLRAKWRKAAMQGTELDLQADLMRYTVDVTSGLAFGQDLNTMELGDDVAIQRHLNYILPALFKRVLSPFDLEHWVPSREQKEHVGALKEAVRGFIESTRTLLRERPELREKPRNLIQSMVVTCDAGGDNLSDEELSANVLTMLLAGEDTTANTLAWMIWLLSQNRGALESARDEVDRVVGRGALAVNMDQLSQLDYVDACANEAMRLKPVAPLIILQAAEDAEIDGVAVRAGTFVMCVMRPAGVDAARFEQPQSFRPERWLHGETDAAHGRMFSAKRVVMPFGAGPRVCPGRYLALAEIKMVMSMLLAHFSIDSVTAADGEPRERLTLVMQPEGLRMKLSER
jgi:cytochrome P450